MTPLFSSEMQEVLDRQPETHRGPGGWFRDNWLAFAMFIAWGLGQAATAGGWIGSRQASESNLASEIQQLRTELTNASRTYVRQDVFDQVLRRIDEKLSTLSDQKQQRRTGGN